MTPQDEFREAVRRLHRAKDAAYRNAWKRRGEVLSILANVARKVDRLEGELDGAPATRDEPPLDTAVDLLVYCLKYQAYLADHDPGIAARMFGHGTIPPYSDGTAGFEALLSHVDLASLTVPTRSAREAASLAVARFADLEACFDHMTAVSPARERLDCLLDLTAAAIGLAGAVRNEQPDAYARFTGACLAMEEGNTAHAG